MDLQLRGKRVLVSGGTKGIGREVIRCFLHEGCLVGFCARDGDAVRATEAEFARIGPPVGYILDVADTVGLRQWVGEMATRWGGLDVIICNASALAIEDTEISWRRSFEVDLMGTVQLVNACIPYLTQSAAAVVIAVASVSGREKTLAIGPYGTMKAAVIAYISGMATKFAKTGIRFNTVSPGNVYHEGGIWQRMQNLDKQTFDEALRRNPTGRMGTPAEIANGIVFLASPVASRISGTNLLIDGALTRGTQF